MNNSDLNTRTMYHFTSERGWQGINEGLSGLIYLTKYDKYVDRTEADLTGLLPTRMIIDYRKIADLPQDAYVGASFGLLDVESWKNNETFSETLDLLLSDIRQYGEKIILLKIDLTEEDNPQILERAHVERLRTSTKLYEEPKPKSKTSTNYFVDFFKTIISSSKSDNISPEDQLKNITKEAYRKYWESKVPLSDYDGSYLLPEVIVTNQIPLERIHLVGKLDFN